MKPDKRFTSLVFLIMATLACLSPAWAEEPTHRNSGKREPIEITSERMRSENNGHKIIFSGNVKSIWGDLTILSDVLEIYSRSSKDGEGDSATGALSENQNLDEIVAIGNVQITKGTRRAKGDRAIYFDKQQKIILTGNPHATAWEADNIIEGKEMIFFLEKDRFVVNDRVHLKLYPKNDEPGKRKREAARTYPDTASRNR